MKIKHSLNGYVVDVPNAVKEKTESGIYLSKEYSFVENTKQYAKVVAVPQVKEVVEVGDIIVYHFNAIVKTKDTKGNFQTSDNQIDETLYHIPTGLVHAVIKQGTNEIIMLNDYCFLQPYKEEEKVSESGIIMEIQKEVSGAAVNSKTNILHAPFGRGVDVGDYVLLDSYSNYEIELPNEELVWCTNIKSLRSVYTDNE